MTDKPCVAIIGTGLAGLACATGLAETHAVTLFDKSRGLSGRLSTRRAETHQFDHGAQYFRAESAGFLDWLAPFRATGHVRVWAPRAVTIAEDGARSPRPEEGERLVFAPGMNAIGKAVMAGRPNLPLYLDYPVDQLRGSPGAWHVHAGEATFGPFDRVVLAIPAAQALALLPETVAFADTLALVKMIGCHTLMLGYAPDEAPPVDWQSAHFDDAMLGYAAWNQTKPGRGAAAALVIQTQHAWSEACIEEDPTAMAALVKQHFARVTGMSLTASAYDRVHRWRYASTVNPPCDAAQPYLYDAAHQLAAIGDWCTGSKVENAFASGAALAEKWRH